MSNDDTTPRELDDGPPKDTNPMLERILEELRALREEMAGMRSDLATFKTELREDLDDMDRELARLSQQDARRWTRLEERIRALEHPEEAKP